MLVNLLLALAATTAPTTNSTITSYSGIARADAHGAVIYRERHFHYGAARDRRELVIYTCPDGKPFARKNVDPGGNAQDPDFALLDARSGYREGVRSVDGQRRVYVKKVGAKHEQSAPLPTVNDPVIDSGFDAYVRAHWAMLMHGKTLKMNFLVPSRSKFMHFEIYRRDDAAAKTQGIAVFRLRLSSWFGFALPHIDVGYAIKNHQLRWFRGLSNIRDIHGDNLTVQLRYPPADRHGNVPAQDLQRARQEPLDGRCRLH